MRVGSVTLGLTGVAYCRSSSSCSFTCCSRSMSCRVNRSISLIGSLRDSESRFYGRWFCATAVEVFVVFVDGLKGTVVSVVCAVHFALVF